MAFYRSVTMTSLHHYTPSLTAIDPRGLSVRRVNYHRLRVHEPPQSRIHQSRYDTRGSLAQQWDPRLLAREAITPEAQPNLRYLSSLSGQIVKTDSVDSGWHVTLCGTGLQTLATWDARGNHQRFEYDTHARLMAIHEQLSNDPQARCIERFTYGKPQPRINSTNQCGRLVRHDDPAGAVLFEAYALSGAMQRQARRFARQPESLNWPSAQEQRDALLEIQSYTTQWHYNAVGDLLELHDAKGNRQRFQYGITGQQAQVDVVMASGKRAVLMDQRTYNAAGQVTSERSGNGVLTVASYAQADGYLQRLTAHRVGSHRTPIQDLAYTHDRVGNVVSILDSAQPTTWSHNSSIEAFTTYTYDTLYQLIKATGRENARHRGGRLLSAPMLMGTDTHRWRNYTRHYQYDAGANLVQMQHVPASGRGYTQRMAVSETSNRSQLSGPPNPEDGFDPCGNLRMLARGQVMAWNGRNQLHKVTHVRRGAGEDDGESYVYDGQGVRVLKRRTYRTKGLTRRYEVRYLPGLELRLNEASGVNVSLMTLQAGHMNVRTLTWEQGLPDGVQNAQIRFTLSDHLESGVIELDEQGALLSQEGFYPFGATAWWAAKSAVQASFKTVRYSGKERDATGLYYYGLRYYAPWMQRWISPDPAGVIDGLNVYAMVGNNPMSRVDQHGLQAGDYPANRLVAFSFWIFVATLLGAALGALLEAPLIGAGVGAALMTGLAFEAQRRSTLPPTESDNYAFMQAITDKVLEFSALQQLSPAESVKMFNFVFDNLAAIHEEVGVSLGILTTKSGEIYGLAGPAQLHPVIGELSNNPRPPTREARKQGVLSVLIRARAQPAATTSRPAAEPTPHEVVTPRAVARQRTARASSSAPQPQPAVISTPTAQPAQAISIDESAVAELLLGPEGHSIALTISHVQQGRFRAVHWHQHADALWSADVHGYQGSRRRGAYRLMFEHLGDRRYRVAGIRDPH